MLALKQDIGSLFNRIMKGDRVALGQAMTLVESERPEDRIEAVELLDLCDNVIATKSSYFSYAISGAPGVGKSTLIESLGLKAIAHGHQVGVITVDPTSHISFGSILGDKSRMQQLSLSNDAFVRSSPAGSLLGGIGRRSREMMTLLGATGYDIIFLETVGVGQSEHIAWQLTDGFMLVLQPGSGDELQGIKRGITELADIVVVNKADGPLRESAAATRNHYENATHYFSPLREGWETKVLTCSALDGKGTDQLWNILRLFIDTRIENNYLADQRKRQNKFWLSWSLGIAAHQLLMNHPEVNQKLTEGLLNLEHQQKSMFKTEHEIENLMRELTGKRYEDF